MTDAEWMKDRLLAWSGSVQRLAAVAPTEAVIEEVGIDWSAHSTPPERAAIRKQARERITAWLERDLAELDRED